eukprot:s16567_g1.t1
MDMREVFTRRSSVR